MSKKKKKKMKGQIKDAKHKGVRLLQVTRDADVLESGSTAERRLLEHAAEVDEMHVIVLSVGGAGEKMRMLGQNVYIHQTRSWNKFTSVIGGWLLARSVAKHVSRNNMLVIAEDTFESGLIGYCVARKTGRPLQLHVQTDFLAPAFVDTKRTNQWRVALAQFVAPRADCIRVTSERIKESLVSFFGEALGARIAVTPHYADVAKPNDEQIAKVKEALGDFEQVFLVALPLSPESNIELAILGLQGIVMEFPKAALVVVGAGTYHDELMELVNGLELTNNVIFLEDVDDLSPLVYIADAYLYTAGFEGAGEHLLDIAKARLPIISTDSGVAGRELADGEHVWVCDTYDEDCVENAMRDILSDPISAIVRAEAAQNRAQEISGTRESHVAGCTATWQNCLSKKTK